MSEILGIKQLNGLIQKINTYKRTNKEMRLTITNQTKSSQQTKLCDFITDIIDTDNIVLYELFDMVTNDKSLSLIHVKSELRLLNADITKVKDNINNIMSVLDDSIYGHTHAKNQIMKGFIPMPFSIKTIKHHGTGRTARTVLKYHHRLFVRSLFNF